MRRLEHPKKRYGIIAAVAMGVGALLAAPPAWASAFCSFDNGMEGWTGTTWVGGGSNYIDNTLGNDAPSFHVDYSDFAIISVMLSNDTDAGFIGDYTESPQVEISIDTYAIESLPRDLIVELRDYDNVPENYDHVSVWARIGSLNDQEDPGWNSYSITIEDTSATEMPDGWHGYGAEDPDTFEMILPEDRTFTDVLADVDEIMFTTDVPGETYIFSCYNVCFDNVAVTQVPEPMSAMLLLVGGFAALIRRR